MISDRIFIEFRGTIAPTPVGELPYDDGIIDHGDGTFSVPAGSPRIRPYTMLKQADDESAKGNL